MADISQEAFRYISDDDAPEAIVNKVLGQLRQTPDTARFTQEDWNKLRNQKPNLHHFIEATSYEAAPDDLEQREKVAAALLGMVVLVQEIDLTQGEQRIIEMLNNDPDLNGKFDKLFLDNDNSSA